MMKRIGFALAALLATHIALYACSKDDGAAGDADAATEGGQADPCSLYTDAGDRCPVVTPKACFPMCDNGGCFCKAGPDGPRWTCVIDTSCVPDGAPIL